MPKRVYPDDRSGPFAAPPTTAEDQQGRQIDIVAVDSFEDEALEDTLEMYLAFDPTDRAQGIPPTGEARIRSWLETIAEHSINVFARHGDDVVGHAVLVPDVDDPESVEDNERIEWELAIFVLQDYQQAGIGTLLLKHLLGHATRLNIEHVWLTVERWNTPAIALYERVGFEQTGSESFEQEMGIRLEGTA
jgi:diamine N-acetyltransferase